MTIKTDYSEYFSKEEYEKTVHPVRLETIINFCAGKSVIDLGAGTGLFLDRLQARGFSTAGVDINDDFINVMKPKGHNVIKSDIRNVDFIPSNSYDTVLCCEILEHLYNPGRALEQACRIAKDKVVLTLPKKCRDYPWHFWEVNWRDIGYWIVIELTKIRE